MYTHVLTYAGCRPERDPEELQKVSPTVTMAFLKGKVNY